MSDQNPSPADLAANPNPADELRTKLADLIPRAFSEGKLNPAALKRALGEANVNEGSERYALNLDLQCRDAGIRFTCL